jgi:hypothetical protein
MQDYRKDTLVNVYSTKENKVIFLSHEGTYYKFEETRRTIDVEAQIPGGSYRTLQSKLSLSELNNLKTLNYALLFVKFKVPYDTIHRMEVFGYLLKETNDKDGHKSFLWQEVSISDRKLLCDKYLALSSSWTKTAKSFFTDFHFME